MWVGGRDGKRDGVRVGVCVCGRERRECVREGDWVLVCVCVWEGKERVGERGRVSACVCVFVCVLLRNFSLLVWCSQSCRDSLKVLFIILLRVVFS